MRVVVDTNVLVSATLKQKSMPGMAAPLVERRGGLLKSTATEQQLFDVIARPRLASLIDPETQAWLRRLMGAAEPVTIAKRIIACRDPTDDKFLELAVRSRNFCGRIRRFFPILSKRSSFWSRRKISSLHGPSMRARSRDQ
jgi:uncharacterized protein